MKLLDGKTFLIALVALQMANVKAQDAQVLNSDALNVDGYVTEPMVTDPELEQVKGELRKQKQTIKINKEKSKNYEELGEATEKLAESMEDYLEEKKESDVKIAEYNKRIECLMDPNNDPKDCKGSEDYVTTGQAAPKVAAKTESESSDLVSGDIKVIPYFAGNMISTENEDIETEYDVGLSVESNITERIAMGISVGYAGLKTMDFGGSQYMGSSLYNPYRQAFGLQGREIEYNNLNADIYGKFFITKKSRFKPYVGLGASYNRSTYKFAEGSNQNMQLGYGMNQANFGNEDLTVTYAAVKAIAGTEIQFTKTIGANLMVQYARGLGDSISQDGGYNDLYYNPDQRRLNELAGEIQSANILSLNMGLIVSF